jgi:hypothetical protein
MECYEVHFGNGVFVGTHDDYVSNRTAYFGDAVSDSIRNRSSKLAEKEWVKGWLTRPTSLRAGFSHRTRETGRQKYESPEVTRGCVKVATGRCPPNTLKA